MARIWYEQQRSRTSGFGREEGGNETSADRKARGVRKEEPRSEKNGVTGRPKSFMPSLLIFLCMLVCVGTWVLILNLYSGGREEVVLCFKLVFQN